MRVIAQLVDAYAVKAAADRIVNELPVADIDADMADRLRSAIVEEDQIAFSQISLGHVFARIFLGLRAPLQAHAVFAENVFRKRRAVKD